MDIPYLSRKFVLSAMLAVVGTLFMAFRLIEAYQWQWVMMATVVSYVVANAIQKRNGEATSIRTDKDGKLISIVTIWDRLKSLCDRAFILAFVAVIITSVFLLKAIIPASVWFVICSALAGAYNIGNSLGKNH